jgi:hypothetical protein
MLTMIFHTRVLACPIAHTNRFQGVRGPRTLPLTAPMVRSSSLVRFLSAVISIEIKLMPGCRAALCTGLIHFRCRL